MNKIKRYIKNIINFFKGIRVSTIYKLVGIFLLIAILFWVYMTWKKNNTFKEKTENGVVLTGTVTNKGENYIIIKDSANNEYLIPNTNEEKFPIGSEVNANVNSVLEQRTDKIPTTITSDKINITNEKTENKNADEEIIAYMKETEGYFNDMSLQEEIKVRFIAIVDFLFYNGTIKNYTLNDLSSKAKLQVLKIALSIDNKIENYIPGYKESITSTTGKVYTGIKTKIIEVYLNTTTKICNYDRSLCEAAKNDFQEIKENFSITWNVIKDLITSGTDNLKEWYEIYSGKSN